MDSLKTNFQNDVNSEFSGREELFASERCLKNYNTDVMKKISKGCIKQTHVSAPKSLYNLAALEFGAGIGALANEYYNQNETKPDCIEIDDEQIQIIKKRGFNCFNTLNDLTKQYDVIYTSNVIEHIEDDVKTLKELYQALKPGGRLAIYVPAFMCLWSQMDELVGHYRRYTRKELKQKATLAGFTILTCYYSDSVGFFAWLYLRIKGYKKPSMQISTPDNSLKFFDKFLYPISRVCDLLLFRHLFGKNLLLIAEKPLN